MSVARLPLSMPDQDVLGELLHSVSQPLTSLRCSLELSLDEASEPQSVLLAIQQAEQVIVMIQLMREYLDAEEPNAGTRRSSLDRVLRGVIEDMTSIAELRGIGLRLQGVCSATVALPESRLRLALQHLALALMASAGERGAVLFLLEEGSTESALRAEVVGSTDSSEVASSTQETIRKVRLAVAQRILETGGLWLTREERDHPRFVLRIPRMLAASRSIV